MMSDEQEKQVDGDSANALEVLACRQSRWRAVSIALLALACMGLFAVLMHSRALSSAYAQGEPVAVSKGTTTAYPGANDVAFIVKRAGYLDAAEAQSLCPDSYEEACEAGARFKLYTIDLVFTNSSTVDCSLDEMLHSVLAIGDAYGNGVNYRASEEASGGSLPSSVPAGGEVSFTYVFTVFDYSFADEQWVQIESERTRFIYSMWPRVESIELKG